MDATKVSTINFSEVYDLVNLINYQDGSVISRQLIKKKEGTVTVFAFDKDEGLSEHTVPFDALVHILNGETKITIDKSGFFMKKGEVIIMPVKYSPCTSC